MIGLVNAIGVAESQRQQGFQRPAENSERAVTNRAPILTAEQAVNRVLHTAVEALEFQQSNQQRKTPDSQESDRFAQADLDSKPGGALGVALDVTG